MTIAVPISQQRISPLLDTAARLLVLTCLDGKEVSRREVILTPQSVEALAATIAELHLDLLLCGAASQSMLRALEQQNVAVRPHLCGDLNEILQAFCHGQLGQEKFRIPSCREDRPLPKTCRRRSRPAAVRPIPADVPRD